MAANCFRASAFALVTWAAGAHRQQETQNRTSQFHAGAASMIVSGITSREEYCLSVANGELGVILLLGRFCAGLAHHYVYFVLFALHRECTRML